MHCYKVCSDTSPGLVINNLGRVSVSYVPLLGILEGRKVMSLTTKESLRLLLQKYNSATYADSVVRALAHKRYRYKQYTTRGDTEAGNGREIL
jgi:hypothetical protein